MTTHDVCWQATAHVPLFSESNMLETAICHGFFSSMSPICASNQRPMLYEQCPMLQVGPTT